MWSSFRWPTITHFSGSQALSIGPFQKVQCEVIYLPYYVIKKMKSCHKFSPNCNIHSKNLDIFGPYKFWTPVKRNISDVWNWNCWPCSVWKLKLVVGGGGGRRGGGGMTPSLPVAMPLWQTVFLKNDFFKKNENK